MKIAYISNSIIPSRTANSLHVMKMCNAFSLNNEVVLLAPSRTKEQEKNVDDVFEFYNTARAFDLLYLPFPEMPGKTLFYMYAIGKTLNKISPDIAYGRYIPGCFSALKSGYRVILEMHAPIETKSKIERFLFKWITKQKRFVRLVVISQALKDIYVESGHVTPNQVIVAHDGADVPKENTEKTKLPGRDNVIKVGYSGHLYKGKGVEVIVKIANTINHVDFHVFGGREKDIRKYEKMVKSENIFFHGFVSQQSLPACINALDICLLPNQKVVHVYSSGSKQNTNISSYTSPLKMFEYMSHAKPIITSDIPVLREVLNESNAIIVPPDDVDAWRDAIVRLHDEELRNKLSKKVFQDFISNYTWSQRAINVLSYIQ